MEPLDRHDRGTAEWKRPKCEYASRQNWDQRLYGLLNAPFPCEICAEPGDVWTRINGTLAAAGIPIGPRSFGPWNDGDAGLVRAAWCRASAGAWGALRPGGAALIDDIDANWGFHSFNEAFPWHPHLVCEAEPIRLDASRPNGRGLFGIVLKMPSP